MIFNGFFNSVDGDRLYNADDLSIFFYSLFTDGVLAVPETGLQVTSGDGLSVNVAPGFALIYAKYLRNTESLTIQMTAAHDTYPRVDRVVVRLDKSQRRLTISTVVGVPAETPVPPELTRNSNTYELSLARVGIRPNANSILASDIIDERKKEEVCGLVRAKFYVDAPTAGHIIQTLYTPLDAVPAYAVGDMTEVE